MTERMRAACCEHPETRHKHGICTGCWDEIFHPYRAADPPDDRGLRLARLLMPPVMIADNTRHAGYDDAGREIREYVPQKPGDPPSAAAVTFQVTDVGPLKFDVSEPLFVQRETVPVGYVACVVACNHLTAEFAAHCATCGLPTHLCDGHEAPSEPERCACGRYEISPTTDDYHSPERCGTYQAPPPLPPLLSPAAVADALEARCLPLRSDSDLLRAAVAHLRTMRNLEQQCVGWKSYSDGLTAACDDLRAERDAFARDIANMKQLHAAQMVDRAEFGSYHMRRADDAVRERDALAAKLALAKSGWHQEQVAAQEERLDELTTERDQLEAKLADAEVTVRTQSGRIADLQSNAKGLVHSNQNLNQRAQAAEAGERRMRTERDRLAMNLRESERHLRNCKEGRDARDRYLAQLMPEVEAIEAERNQLAAKVAELEEKATHRVCDWHTSIAPKYEGQIADLTATVETQRQCNERILADLNFRDRQVTTRDLTIVDLTAKLAVAERTVPAKYKEEMGHQIGRIVESSNARIGNLNAQNGSLRAKLAASEEAHRDAEGRVMGLMDETADLRKRLGDQATSHSMYRSETTQQLMKAQQVAIGQQAVIDGLMEKLAEAEHCELCAGCSDGCAGHQDGVECQSESRFPRWCQCRKAVQT